MIFFCYSFAILSALLLPLFPPVVLLDAFQAPMGYASLYVVLMFLGFLSTYGLCRILTEQGTRQAVLRNTAPFAKPPFGGKDRMVVRKRYLALLALWAVIGAGIAALQIQLGLGLGHFLDMVSQGGRAAEQARGLTVGLEASDGGLPGFIKMWNQNCTTSVLMLFYFAAAGYRIRGIWSWCLVAVIAFSFMVRNSLYMDRLALLAIIPALYPVWRNGSQLVRRGLIAVALGIGVLAEIQSQRRGYGIGAAEYFVFYVQSGMINLSLMIDTFSGSHTWGLATIFAPLAFVLKAMGVRPDTSLPFVWGWDAAQDAYGSFFQDFGWFGPLLGLPFGVAAYYLDRARRQLKQRDCSITSFGLARVQTVVAYGALSTMFVPSFAGPEFWLTCGTIFALSVIEGKRSDLLLAVPSTSIRSYSKNQAHLRLLAN